MKHFFAAAMAMCLIIAACGKVTPDNNDPIKTGEATQITQNSAILWGAVDPSALGQGVEMGIIYSDSENPSVENGIIRVSRELDKDNKFFVEAKGLTAGTKFYYKAFLNVSGTYRMGEVKSFTTEEYKFKNSTVDLGLTVKWASCNLGASAPEEYGDYYAWGETAPKADYSWSTYRWGSSSSTLTKYNNNDHKTSLDIEDDAAHIKFGGKWRMPSDAEWADLRNQCKWTWITYKGVNGMAVTSKINGNSIFLPAAGDRSSTCLGYAGSFGFYRSSSLTAGLPNSACFVNFGSDYVCWSYCSRYYGFSVRPVTE